MKNGKLVKAAVVALSCTFGLVGCGTYNHQASNKSKDSQFASAAPVSKSQQASSSQRTVVSQVAQNDQQSTKQLVSSTYNFKFDNSELSQGAKVELDQFAQYLSNNPEAKVHVEGYADARGKSNYNLALGMRRAESVAKYLKENGVRDNQIEVRSFGAERLAEMGDNTEAHAANRRAVVYFEVDSEVA